MSTVATRPEFLRFVGRGAYKNVTCLERTTHDDALTGYHVHCYVTSSTLRIGGSSGREGPCDRRRVPCSHWGARVSE